MKKLLLLCLSLCMILFTGFAADKDDAPVSWNVQVRPVSGDTYKLIVNAKMKEGFHIWALEAGGDGSLINTEISLEQFDIHWVDEDWRISKKPKTETYEYIEGAVHYFDKQVEFSRNFTGAKGTVIKGTITYQSCNEAMCFPPEDVPFEVVIK
ncbi:MAG: hypothetical protein BGO31_17425 [Bacteroidetes bacterium 43-16]|nr:MAG: hypothetical protein BGO31_17425 [Bacteroidetes bacterium 43-16]